MRLHVRVKSSEIHNTVMLSAMQIQAARTVTAGSSTSL